MGDALPTHWSCPLVLAPARHSPSSPSGLPRSTCSGCGSCDSCPSPGSLEPVSISQSLSLHPHMQGPLWGLLAPKDLLEKERQLVGRNSGGPSPSTSQVVRPQRAHLWESELGLSSVSRLWTNYPNSPIPPSVKEGTCSLNYPFCKCLWETHCARTVQE